MSSLLASGIELSLVGMGTVFVFLTFLIGAMTLMSRTILHFVPVVRTDHEINPDHLVAIAAAIAEHRQRL